MIERSVRPVKGETETTAHQLHRGLAGRVRIGSFIVWVLASAALSLLDRNAAAGLVSGGAVSLGVFCLHMALFKVWHRARLQRGARIWLGMVWVVILKQP